MIERLFKGSISLAVLVIVAGIVAAPLVGSSKAFEIAPVFSVGRGLWQWITQSALDSTQPETNPQPFSTEAQAAAGRLHRATSDALGNLPAVQADPRLSICPTGSIDIVSEVPLTTAIAFKDQIGQRQPKDLMEVQGSLGNPVCNWLDGNTRHYRYLVVGGRIIDATQQSDRSQVELSFTNF